MKSSRLTLDSLPLTASIGKDARHVTTVASAAGNSHLTAPDRNRPLAPKSASVRKHRHKSVRELAEDVFDLVEDGGATLGGLVVHLECSVELFHELPLLFGQL